MPNVFIYVVTEKFQSKILSFLKYMLSLSVKRVIYLIFALVYKPLNSVISIMLVRPLEMPSRALVENSFWDTFFPNMAHERFEDLFSHPYPGKSPSDLSGILILVKIRIYMTQAK